MAKAKPAVWRNRIIGHDEVPAEDLLANPNNFRIHPQNQQDVMAGMLEEVGWVDEVKVNKRTGFVVDGHMRAAMAISRNETVPVTYLDLTPEEEALVLASFNPIATLAVPDEGNLNSLLEEIETTNPTLTQFFDGLYSEVNQAALKKTSEDGDDISGTEESETTPRSRGLLRTLMFVDDIGTLEKAILQTGETVRSAALAKIAKFYVDAGSETRQLDKKSKSSAKK